MRHTLKYWKNRILGSQKAPITSHETDLNKLLDNGLTIGESFNMLPECVIDFSHCWHIKIGNSVTLAPRVMILAHDASTKMHLDHTKVKNVVIGNYVFIGANSIVLPGVNIGDNVIVGAGSVLTKNVPSNSVVAGNPAKFICTIEEYLAREKANMKPSNTFGAEYTLDQQLTQGMKEQMLGCINEQGCLYVF